MWRRSPTSASSRRSRSRRYSSDSPGKRTSEPIRLLSRDRRELSLEAQLFAQDLLHDLVGAAAHGTEASVADRSLDPVLAHVAVAAVDLQAVVGDLDAGTLRVELGH